MRALLFLLPLLVAACVKQEPTARPQHRTDSPEITVSHPVHSVTSRPDASPMPSNAAELREWLLLQDRIDAASRDRGNDPGLNDCRVFAIPGRASLFAVIEDRGMQRYAGVYRCEAEAVRYLGSLGTHGSNGLWDVAGFEILKLPQLDNPIVAIYATTGHGNGSFFIYEIDEAEPVELLERERAIGEGWKGENRCLVPTWIDLNNDGYTDVVLSGSRHLVYWDERSATEEVIESYAWNPFARCFEPTS